MWLKTKFTTLYDPLKQQFLPWMLISIILAASSSFLFTNNPLNNEINSSLSMCQKIALDICVALFASFSIYFTNANIPSPIVRGILLCVIVISAVLSHSLTFPYALFVIFVFFHIFLFSLTMPLIYIGDFKQEINKRDKKMKKLIDDKKQDNEGVKLS